MLHVPYAWCWPQVSLCMQLLKPFGFAEEQLNSVVGTVTFPYYAQSRGVTGKDAFAKSSSGFNPPASESLTLYPIIRLVLMDCLETFPHDNVLMRAGRSLCYMFDLLDLLVQTMKTHHQVSPQQISDAARVHVQAFKDIHSPQAILPKHHYELHLGVQMRNHNYLGSCFCHERRHKDIKRYATQLAHVSDTFDVTIMKECLAAQFQTWDQEESPCLDGSALKKPTPAPRLIREELNWGEDVFICDVATLSSGRQVAKGDVVLTSSGVVAELWLNAECDRHYFALISKWLHVGPNKFKVQDKPCWVDGSELVGAFMYIRTGDTVTVVPQDFWKHRWTCWKKTVASTSSRSLCTLR